MDSIAATEVYEPPLLVEIGTFGGTTFGGPDEEIPEDFQFYPIEG